MTRFATPEDNELLRSIVMHPDVRFWNAEDGAPDFDPTKYTAHPKSRAIVVEGGCWLLAALEQDAYGVHTNLLPTCRGRDALEAAELALEFVFVQMDAMQLWTMVPANNPQAKWFAHRMGFLDQYTRAGAWLQGGKHWAMSYMRTDVDRWIQSSTRLQAVGDWFHQSRRWALKGGAPHEDDPIHDRYVGAALALIQAGQFDKARHIYNRWARACGYQPFDYLSLDPVKVDIGDAVVTLTADGLTFEEPAHA